MKVLGKSLVNFICQRVHIIVTSYYSYILFAILLKIRRYVTVITSKFHILTYFNHSYFCTNFENTGAREELVATDEFIFCNNIFLPILLVPNIHFKKQTLMFNSYIIISSCKVLSKNSLFP